MFKLVYLVVRKVHDIRRTSLPAEVRIGAIECLYSYLAGPDIIVNDLEGKKQSYTMLSFIKVNDVSVQQDS